MGAAPPERLSAQARTDLLRAAHLRVTRPRLAVLEVLASHPHARAETLLRAVREHQPISTQTVYDVLGQLTEAGITRRIQPAGSPALYELHTAEDHHHAVCRSCGAVVDVEGVVGDPSCLRPESLNAAVPGFRIDEAEVTFWGLCPDCSRAAKMRP
jgi:Fe2+ or Zn2+ uptake regulation protein